MDRPYERIQGRSLSLIPSTRIKNKPSVLQHRVEIIRLTACSTSVSKVVSDVPKTSCSKYRPMDSDIIDYVLKPSEHCYAKSDTVSYDDDISNEFTCKYLNNFEYSEFESNSVPKRKFLENWKSSFPFIQYDDKKNLMFCKICNQHAEERHHSIPFVAGTNNFRASSIHYHEQSAVHAKYQKKAVEESSPTIHTAKVVEVLREHDNHREKLVHILKSVYFIVKTKSPYTFFPHLCETQKKDGVDIGVAYTSHHKVVPKFAKYIALAFESDLSEQLKNIELFSLILDGSFERSIENHKLVYINYIDQEVTKTCFLGVIDCKEKTDEGILQSLSKLFDKYGISKWRERLISIITDGDSMYHAWNARLTLLLKNVCPKFIVVHHCLAHKVEISAKEIVQNDSCASQFASLIWNIYWYTTKLFEDQKYLINIGKELDLLLEKYGNLPKNKWVIFYFDALYAINTDWVSLVNLLKTEKNALYLDNKTKKSGAKILSAITRSSFICKMALILDLFVCLKTLSKELHKNSVLIYSVYDIFEKICVSIEKASKGEGINVKQFSEELLPSSGIFRNIEIKIDMNMPQIVNQMGCLGTALCMHLKSMTGNLSTVKIAAILDPNFWSDNVNSTLYGNEQFKELFIKFNITDEKELQIALSEWCLLKQKVVLDYSLILCKNSKATILKMISNYKELFPVVINFLKKFLLMDASHPEAETGYLEMNLIKSSIRSTLSVSSLHDSMMIAIYGPSQAQFNPVPALELWLNQCNRRYVKRTKSSKKHFKHDEASECEPDYFCCIDPISLDVL